MRSIDERGVALPAAIGALVIMGILVTAGFYMARQELRIGVASKHAALALNIAQVGANDVMANWSGYQLGNIAVGSDTTLTDSVSGGVWTVSIRNANNFIYHLDVTGTVTEGGALWAGATRSIGIVTKMLYADIDPPAALTTRGTTIVKGNAVISGMNTTPASWAPYCTTFSTNDVTGVLTNDTSLIGTGGGGTISGSPAYDQDSTIVDATFTNFGDMNWEELVALARAEGKDVTSWGSTPDGAIEPDTTGSGGCNDTTLTNWGDTLPSAACGSYFPLIYHGGPELRMMAGGYGQGILLVDGDLSLRGGFLFYGIIIVQGTFSTQGSGNRIIGAVLAANGTIDDQSVTGGSEITYSKCAVQRAILNNSSLSRARPLTHRSWVDLTAVRN